MFLPCGLQRRGKKLYFVSHSAFIIHLLSSCCWLSWPWLQSQAPSHDPNSTKVLLLPPLRPQQIRRWFPPQPRKITLAGHTTPAPAPSRTLRGHFPVWVSRRSRGAQARLVQGAVSPLLCSSAPGKFGRSWDRLIAVTTWALLGEGPTHLSVRTLFKSPCPGQHLSSLLHLGPVSCVWYKRLSDLLLPSLHFPLALSYFYSRRDKVGCWPRFAAGVSRRKLTEGKKPQTNKQNNPNSMLNPQTMLLASFSHTRHWRLRRRIRL